jgi:hypothetical protein
VYVFILVYLIYLELKKTNIWNCLLQVVALYYFSDVLLMIFLLLV